MTDTRNIAPAPKRRAGALPEAPVAAAEPAPGPTAGAGKPPRPTALAEAYPWLLRPFPPQVVELKPTATTRDKTRALASPYVDPRVYFSRLDKICGAENWSNCITLTERGAVCALTIFGVTKSATGDYPITVPGRDPDENPATSAEMQAFKRACAAFGLGRYLYSLPQVWGDYDEKSKQIVNPAGIVAQMYAALPREEE